MPSLVSVIETDVDDIRVALRHLEYLHAHTFQSGQITRGRRTSSRGRFRGRIDRINIEVLISVVILRIKDVLAVSRPEISCDRPFGLRGKQARSGERFIHCLDINIASVFPGFQKGDVLAIGRKLRGRNFWIAKDYIAINELWRTTRFVCGGGGEGRNEENTQEDESEVHMRQFLSVDTWNASGRGTTDRRILSRCWLEAQTR